MITQAIDHLAEFAYGVQLRECENLKPPGFRSVEFRELPHKIQKAWNAVARETLREWLRTEFVDAIYDDDFMEELIKFMKGDGDADELSDLYRNAVSFFVVSLINPKMVDMEVHQSGDD